MGNMGSAHPLVEVNVSFKFEGNPSISKGVIEWTRIGDGRTDQPTDGTKRIQYSPPTFCGGGIVIYWHLYCFVYQILTVWRNYVVSIDFWQDKVELL